MSFPVPKPGLAIAYRHALLRPGEAAVPLTCVPKPAPGNERMSTVAIDDRGSIPHREVVYPVALKGSIVAGVRVDCQDAVGLARIAGTASVLSSRNGTERGSYSLPIRWCPG